MPCTGLEVELSLQCLLGNRRKCWHGNSDPTHKRGQRSTAVTSTERGTRGKAAEFELETLWIVGGKLYHPIVKHFTMFLGEATDFSWQQCFINRADEVVVVCLDAVNSFLHKDPVHFLKLFCCFFLKDVSVGWTPFPALKSAPRSSLFSSSPLPCWHQMLLDLCIHTLDTHTYPSVHSLVTPHLISLPCF